jgi:hypothetical protein
MEREGRVFRRLGKKGSRPRVLRQTALFMMLGATATFLGCAMWEPEPKAAATLNCPAEQIQIEENTAYSVVARGCGKADVIVMEGGGKASSLRERAAFEFSCPDADISVKILSTSLYGVTGCGKKVMYKYVPYVGIVADTAQKTGDASPSPAAPAE